MSGPARRVAGLDIDEGLPFQRHLRTLQRAAFAGSAVLVVAALAGLLGTGPLAHATASSPGGLEVATTASSAAPPPRPSR
jgi:hypothetical protein